jgi:hypothetical protein
VPHAVKAESLVLTAPAASPFPPDTDLDAEHDVLIASDAPAEPTHFALKGRIVCMDDAGTVIPSGIVFVTGNRITVRVWRDPTCCPRAGRRRARCGSGAQGFSMRHACARWPTVCSCSRRMSTRVEVAEVKSAGK